MPRGHARAGEVVGLPDVLAPARHGAMRNRIGEIARRRRRAALVGDYPQLLALLRQPHHRLEKIVPKLAV